MQPLPPEPVLARLLVVDDDERFRGRLVRALRRRSPDVTEAASVAEALSLAATAAATGRPYTAAVIDLRLGDGDGATLVEGLLRLQPGLRALILTGYGSIATALDAVRRGAWHYLTKPTDADTIALALRGERGAPIERVAEVARDATAPSLARVEWEHIQRVLADSEGNISEASRRLGMHRRSLQRKLGRLPPAS